MSQKPRCFSEYIFQRFFLPCDFVTSLNFSIVQEFRIRFCCYHYISLNNETNKITYFKIEIRKHFFLNLADELFLKNIVPRLTKLTIENREQLYLLAEICSEIPLIEYFQQLIHNLPNVF